jgi:hypothetical protein
MFNNKQRFKNKAFLKLRDAYTCRDLATGYPHSLLRLISTVKPTCYAVS